MVLIPGLLQHVFKPVDGGMCVMVLDCWQDHLQYPQLRPKVIDEFETVYGEGKDRKLVDVILVEDKSAGISLIQDLQQAHLPVIAYNPGRARMPSLSKRSAGQCTGTWACSSTSAVLGPTA